MRSWLFHPVLFYPLALLFAAFVIVVSIRPQSWPRDPAPVMAQADAATLVLEGEAFTSPASGASQSMTVVRDFWGRAEALRIAQPENQGPPTDTDDGVRILLTPAQAAQLDGRPVTIEVSYNPLPVTAASHLAVSLRGTRPAPWVAQEAPPQSSTLRFSLPAANAISAIGLRAVSESQDQAYGLEITRVRLTPG